MRIVSAGIALLLGAVWCPAQEPITVDVALFPPNVMESASSASGFEGFDVELWQEIARIAGIEYTFRRVPFDQLLSEVEVETAAAGLAGITITESREARMDFSHPYMRSGLRILAGAKQNTDFLSVVRALLASGAFRWLWYLALFLILCSHLLYFAERGKQAIDRRYFPGIFEAGWCTLATMTTVGYGDITPKGWAGRFVACLVMVTGIGLFGIVIAELSAGLTLQRLTSEIESAEDLRGRAVATVAGTTSVELLEELGARVVTVEHIEQAYEKLRIREVAAVVFDAPSLLYYMKNNPSQPLTLVGGLLRNESYGIAFPSNSPLREPVNRALLQVRENGVYGRIYEKWFGSEE